MASRSKRIKKSPNNTLPLNSSPTSISENSEVKVSNKRTERKKRNTKSLPNKHLNGDENSESDFESKIDINSGKNQSKKRTRKSQIKEKDVTFNLVQSEKNVEKLEVESKKINLNKRGRERLKKGLEEPSKKRRTLKPSCSTTVKNNSIINKEPQEENKSENGAVNNNLNSPLLDKKIKLVDDQPKTCDLESDSSTSDDDWEEVPEEPIQDLEDYNPVLPKEGVDIVLEGPVMNQRRKHKSFDLMDIVRLQINRIKKENQVRLHQVHLLCLMAHGIYLNKLLNSEDIQAFVLSVLPSNFFDICKKNSSLEMNIIIDFIEWFKKAFSFSETENVLDNSVKDSLYFAFENQCASNVSEYNLLFVALARCLGMNVRLCMSLYPVTFKAKDLIQKQKDEKTTPVKSSNSTQSNKSLKKSTEKKNIVEKVKSVKKDKKEIKTTQSGKKSKLKVEKTTTTIKSRPSRTKKVVSYEASFDENDIFNDDDDDDFIPEKTTLSSDNDDDNEDVPEKSFISTPIVKKEIPAVFNIEYNTPSVSNFKKGQTRSVSNIKKEETPSVSNVKKKISKTAKKNRKILSSDSESAEDKKGVDYVCKKGVEYWAEIYSKAKERWICIECCHNIVDEPYKIEGVATQPISYVLAYNNESCIKDVTKRYCSEWMTQTRKLRIETDWWQETLEPFLPPNDKLDIAEDSQLELVLSKKPMPITISGFKSHPLYALKRHLLKFEAIYPPDAAPIGFIRQEPIYTRENIHNLHSRETWLKEARVVRRGEEPYKIVKARPKWDKFAGVLKTDLPLEIFGFWQTEKYMPPIAQNGKVPRNEYGNVELFKPCMLPVGTVHLRIPCLNRIAKKLGIDCSPAVVGFDGHKGSVHPVFDGFIVCEEFKDTLLLACEEEERNVKKREEEKRLKRVYGNWKRLVKAYLIREKLKRKYGPKTE